MKRLIILTALALAVCTWHAGTALADDMNEHFVAGTVSDQSWEPFFATSSESLMQAKKAAAEACGGTPFCNEKVVGVERGCVAYAESAESWALHAEMTMETATGKALEYCARESDGEAPCKVTGVWCADR